MQSRASQIIESRLLSVNPANERAAINADSPIVIAPSAERGITRTDPRPLPMRLEKYILPTSSIFKRARVMIMPPKKNGIDRAR